MNLDTLGVFMDMASDSLVSFVETDSDTLFVFVNMTSDSLVSFRQIRIHLFS